MGSNASGLDRLSGATAAPAAPRIRPPAAASASASAWDRFALWSRGEARVTLALLFALLLAAALTPLSRGDGAAAARIALAPGMVPAAAPVASGPIAPDPATPNPAVRPRDADLRLYDTVVARMARGERYYDFIADQQRRDNFPVHPGFAIRLPTLAWLEAQLGLAGEALCALALLAGVCLAWWRKLGEEPGGAEHRRVARGLLLASAALGLNRYYFVLHELWAGMLIALAMALHRPLPRGDGGHWHGAWLAAALALMIRELTLPFVLLLLASAMWRRAWREAAAWAALIGGFAIVMAVHLTWVAALVRPDDPAGPGWLALRGLAGWLGNIMLTSSLRFLPHWLAAPLVVLALFGWAGWRSATGAFATLLYLGYGLAFMIAGRAENFYWGAMITPALFVGLAFAPMAARSLWHRAWARGPEPVRAIA